MTLREGINIEHKTFGMGCIIKKDADKLTVLFKNTKKVVNRAKCV